MAIGNVLASIFSKTASTVVDSVGNALDKNFTSQDEKEKNKIELQKIISDELIEMQRAANTVYMAELADMANARDREIKIATSKDAPLINKIIQPVLAIGTVILTFILFYIVMFKQLGTEKDIIIYILGALTAITGQIFSYFFGSSSGSSAKQGQLNKMLNEKE